MDYSYILNSAVPLKEKLLKYGFCGADKADVENVLEGELIIAVAAYFDGDFSWNSVYFCSSTSCSPSFLS